MPDSLRQVQSCFQYTVAWRIFFAVIYTFVVLWPLAIAAIAVAIYGNRFEFWPLALKFAHPLGLGWVWYIFLAASGRMFWTHRPVCISDHGVIALMFGREWRRIAWSDLARVEKEISFEYERGGIVETIRFVSNRRSVSVRSYISNFAEMKRAVNAYLRSHQIEVRTRDSSGPKTVASTERPGSI